MEQEQSAKQKPINCEFWQDAGIYNGGKCLLGRYGGCPSFGICRNHCSYFSTNREAKHSSEIIMDYVGRVRNAIVNVSPYPSHRFSGRGIVMCAGGVDLFAMVWVNIQIMRGLGCTLPIEVWHLGSKEMDDDMRDILSASGATAVDAFEFPDYPTRGWPLKPFSMLNNGFEEFIFIDSDNFPVHDPSVLFQSPGYVSTGALFWHDISVLADPRLPIILGLPVSILDRPEQESGMMVVDKRKGWRGLNTAWAMNKGDAYDFFSQYMLGEKDAYWLSWELNKIPYKFVEVLPIRAVSDCLYQHNENGEVVFEHRAGYYNKWNFVNGEIIAKDMIYEQEIIAHAESLGRLWDGVINEGTAVVERN